MAVASKKKPSTAKKKVNTKSVNGSLDLKNIDSEQMLFFVLQDIKTSINKLDQSVNARIDRLDDKIETSISKLDDKIDSNFRWTIGIMITMIGVMIGGFIGLVAIILSKL